MKKFNLLLAGLIVGSSACVLASCGKPYTVTITIDGVAQMVEVKKDEIPQRPTDPVKEGYNFRGWYLDEAGEQEYKFDKPLNADSTLYAIFDEKEYTITFVVEGEETKVNFKWSETPSFPTPKKDGYVFKNWCSDEALNNTFEFTQPLRTEMTFYAKFVEAYKVQYVVTPNEENTSTEIVETELETAPIRPADPVVEGYTFDGWFLDETFSVPFEFDQVLEPETAIYAKLTEKQYTITYTVGGVGEELFTETYNYWTVPTEPETPEYEGQYFFGYYLDEAFTSSYDFSYTFKEDTTIYLQFLESKPIYTVEELIAIAEYPAGNYQLQNDLTLKWKPWAQIPEFSGKFDGNGYKIYDFTMSTTTSNSGFFAVNKGTIKNLTLESFNFTSNYGGASNVGVLVAENNGTIENCVVRNAVEEGSSGCTYKNTREGTGFTANYSGLVGQNNTTGVIKNCDVFVNIVLNESWVSSNGNYNSRGTFYSYTDFGGAVATNKGTVSKVTTDVQFVSTHSVSGAGGCCNDHSDYGYLHFYAAGVVGNNSGTVTQCVSEFSTTNTTTVGSRAGIYNYGGGFVCENTGDISESIARGSIEFGGSASSCNVGGFVRLNSGVISDCYSDTTIKTTTTVGGYVGGFVSHNTKYIMFSYALGSIDTKCNGNIGGFVGYSDTNAEITNSFAVVDVTTVAGNVGAFVGNVVSGNSSVANCYYSSEVVITKNGVVSEPTTVTGVLSTETANLYSVQYLQGKMYWNDEANVWNIDGVNAPTLLWEPVVEEVPEETPEA